MECFSEDLQRKIHFTNQPDDFIILPSLQENLNHSRPDIKNSDIKILAAMPALNEEKSIAKTILKVRKYVDGVLVVDDGSTDSTAEIAEALGAIVVQHSGNNGYGAALQTIFQAARELFAEELVIIDADGQHNPDEIPILLQKLHSGADIVIGSRFLEGTKNNIPHYRKFGMKVLDTATNFAGNINVSDSQSGFRAYSKRAIWMTNILENGMSAGSEILLQGNHNGLKIMEVPIHVRYDLEDTSSKNPIFHGLEVLNNIVDLISYRRPMFLFGLSGLICLSIGLGAGIAAYIRYSSFAELPLILAVLSGLLLFLGIIFTVSGLILHSLGKLFSIYVHGALQNNGKINHHGRVKR